MTSPGAAAISVLVALPRLASAQSSTAKSLTLDHTRYMTDTPKLGTLSKQTSMLAATKAPYPQIKQPV